MSKRLYGNVVLRMGALFHDVVLYTVVVVFVPNTVAALAGFGISIPYDELLMWIGFVALYEPILVWQFGGTWGHHECKLRVCDQDTGANLGYFRALFRAVLKTVLGVFSLLFMLSTERHQALHDLVTRSTVQIRDPKLPFGPRHHYVAERAEVENVILPSTRRRIIVILAYIVLILFVLASLVPFARIATGAKSCVSPDQCPLTAQVIDAAMFVIWILLSAVAVRLGWKGLLPGCSRRMRGAASS